MANNTNYDSDYSVRLATLAALGGDATQCFDSTYEIDLAILEIINGGISALVIDDNNVSTGTTYSSSKLVQLISDAGFKIEVVQSLPATGVARTLYFAPSTNPETGNVYDEFIYTNNAWEQVGSTAVDLSAYAKIADVDASLALKQDVLTAGDNISINGNVISAIVPDLTDYATKSYVDASVNSINNIVTDLSTNVADNELVISYALNNLSDKIDDVSAYVVDLSTNIYTYVNDLSTNIYTYVNDLSTNIADVSANVDDLSTNIADVSAYVVDLSTNIYTYVNDLSTNIADVSANVDDLSTNISTNYAKVVTLTLAEYDALVTKDANTIYVISDAE